MVLMTGPFVIVVLVILVFFSLQKYYIRGRMLGGIKAEKNYALRNNMKI
jgi:ABC-type glycerol-3-phosphate transport system permease component